MNTKDKLVLIMSQVLGIDRDQIDEQTALGNPAQWDSLQHLNLILALEEEFDVQFETDEIPQATRYVVLCSMLEAKLAQRTAESA